MRRPGETDKSWRKGGRIACADSDLLVYWLLTLASVPSDRSKYEYAGQPASLWVQNEAICKPTRTKTPEKHFRTPKSTHPDGPLCPAVVASPSPLAATFSPRRWTQYLFAPPSSKREALSAARGTGRPCGVSPSRARSTLDPCSKTDGPTRAGRQQIASRWTFVKTFNLSIIDQLDGAVVWLSQDGENGRMSFCRRCVPRDANWPGPSSVSSGSMQQKPPKRPPPSCQTCSRGSFGTICSLVLSAHSCFCPATISKTLNPGSSELWNCPRARDPECGLIA